MTLKSADSCGKNGSKRGKFYVTLLYQHSGWNCNQNCMKKLSMEGNRRGWKKMEEKRRKYKKLEEDGRE